MNRSKRFAALWFPEWPIHCRLARRPDLERVAVVLHRRKSNAREVAAACRRAGALGVRIGMSLSEACSLAGAVYGSHPETQPQPAQPAQPARQAVTLHLEEHDPALDRARLTKIARWSQRYSPLVSLDDAAEPDAIYVDVTGCALAFGGEEKLAADASRRLRKRRYAPRIAVADTPAAAWALARFADLPPLGWLVAPHGACRSLVRPLPAAALRPADDTAELLRALGLDTVGQIADLPRKTLSVRFGDAFVSRLHFTLGEWGESHPAVPQAIPLTVACDFETPVSSSTVLDRVRRTLINRLAAKLPATHGVTRIDARLRDDAGGTTVCRVELARPKRDGRRLDELMRLRWDRLAFESGLTALRFSATVAVLARPRQGDLFDDGDADASDFDDLSERLVSRLGRGNVVRTCVRSDPQPELAVVAESVMERSASQPSTARAAAHSRPTLLLAKPVRMTAEEGMDGVPKTFMHDGERVGVRRCVGPERIETGWWRGPSVRRDYYCIELDDGRRWWAFRELETQRWFLHGWFD